jgi:hypothetical protein
MSRSRAAVAIAASAIMLGGLAACVSPEELRAEDVATCRSFGFQAGTPDFAACLQRESLARRYYAPPPPQWYGGPRWWGPGYYPPPPGWAW